MKLAHRPGMSTAFIDSATDEKLLEIGSSADGASLVAFHLYDSHGMFVLDSDGLRSFPVGTEVRALDEELLLTVPEDNQAHIQYRLYSSEGRLITCSDGIRTQIFPYLRMEGARPLASSLAPRAAKLSSVPPQPA